MKLYFRIVAIAVMTLFTACSSTLEQARTWLDGKSGKTDSNISGHWFCSEFGIFRIEQNGNKLTGISSDFNIEGSANESDYYLIFYKQHPRITSALVLRYNNENQLYGKSSSSIILDSRAGSDIQIKRVSLENLLNEQWYIDYYKMRRVFNTLQNGKRWLKIMEGVPKINITGAWNNTEWGGASFIQDKNVVQGILGTYQVDGVINDNLVFMLILYKNKIYYTAVMDGRDVKYMKGKYFDFIAYSVGYKGFPIILMK